ncbi:MAG TPA: hypothetical protein VFR64_04405 [Methylomirabilota bacterium]|nr:hypothetical protein [Methylomirabilota bacterium]
MPAQDLIIDLVIRYGFQVLGRSPSSPSAFWPPGGPAIWPSGLGAAQIEPLGVRLGVHPWVRVPDVVPAEAELYQALTERLGAAGIGVPLLRQEVRLLDGAPAGIAAR